MWGEFTLCLLATCNTIQAIQSSSTYFLPNPHFQILSPYELPLVQSSQDMWKEARWLGRSNKLSGSS